MTSPRLLLIPPLLGLLACVDGRTPTALDRAPRPSASAEAVLVPVAGHATFAVLPEAPDVVCTPAAYGIHPPAVYGGEGVMSHLGRIEVEITFDACTIDPARGLFLATGHVVQIAADGDQLWGTFGMTQQLNGDFTLDDVTLTGGTGRFANATGSGSGSGWISRGEGGTHQGYFDVHGSMSRPNQ